ncbi:2-oxoacid:acceptor oxidoreductase subunit alpha [Desulfobulbus rhabdoformis]|uniref:2-oxoacid:acceptor oxidoreductase subunit alpha n=1 Tax=Desulfobulbus rhabdoformis TaxID=34032 RepID=UPI001964D4A8|nr:2-oxoacid:acceptor oxidoreductase subunit alpha [Desulfobulbus rhabdoformis]MBM9614256.1 2-oxoacid:acceptor oxidoreductase subunit alpha [Desulfobulbus rhabdoformis]
MTNRPSLQVNLMFGGEAGQGLQTLGLVLARALRGGGLHVFAVNEFMSRIRGGSNSLVLRAADSPVRSPSDRIDCCVLLDSDALPRLADRLGEESLLVGDPALFSSEQGVTPLPLKELSKQAGGAVFGNSIVCGFILRMLGWELAPLNTALAHTFSDAQIQEKNRRAAQLGWEYAENLAGRFPLPLDQQAHNRLLLDGSQVVALGAVAGGCNFISSYPMSPATGVLIHLARLAADHGIVVEQAEDEISAVNMGIGAWYAGARALVSTSGGGFDLMGEGLSLAGIMELPLVIHIAQRPGPGTGLPTRTEQGDLEIARYSGHGEYPRAILAPGSPEEAYDCARHAFTMADASQSPVLLLTDQYLLDSLYDIETLPLPHEPPKSEIVATEANYERYAASATGLSPRGVPGLGQGFVCVDSDEHDAQGRITEDFDTRVAMVDKRMAKGRLLETSLALPPRLYGPQLYHTLLISWGSTGPTIEEALKQLALPEVALLHCTQVYPLPQEMAAYLERAKRIIVVENNATGQFARLLRAETGCTIDDQWLKYNGLAFSVEEIIASLRKEGGNE